MRLRAFLLADAVSADAGGKAYLHGAALSEVKASSFPLTHPQLALYALLEQEDEPYGSDHTLAVRLLGPGESALNDLGINFRLERDEDGEELPARVNLIMTLNGIVFPEPGMYSFALFVDDDEVDRLPFRVRQVGPEALNA